MSSPRAIDPMAVVIARPFIVGSITASLGYAALVIATNLSQVYSPQLMALAVLALVTAGVVLFLSTSPFRRQPSFGRTAFIVGLALLAFVLESLAQIGSPHSIYDNWGTVTLALILISISSFRSANELILMTLGACVPAGVLIALTVGDDPSSRIVAVIVGIMPPLATGAAAAAFSRSMTGSLRAWMHEASSAQADAVDELRSEVAGAVREERLELLNFEIVPFLQGILESGTLTAPDSDRARDLASVLRETMVDDAGTNWLDAVADRVEDRDRLAEQLGAEQRGSLTAIIGELQAAGYARPGSIAARLIAQDDQVAGTITIGLTETIGLRTFLAPFFAVAQATLDGAHLELGAEDLVIEFRVARA